MEKIKKTAAYCSESIDKIRSSEWSAPVASALGVTGSIIEGLGNFVPGLGILGGALKMGSEVLNPQPKLSDLRKTEKSLRIDIEKLKHKSVSPIAIESLSKDLGNIQNSIENFNNSQSEIIEDFQRLRLDVNDQFKIMSKEMRSLESDVKELKDIVTATFELIVDQRYKDGIESIEAAYQTFLDGANNIDATLASFDYYIVELQTNFNQHLKPEKIEEYLRIIKNHHGPEMCQQMFNYILVVKSKYLQIMTIYYIHKKDVGRITCNYERFNEHYFDLKERMEKVLAEENKIVENVQQNSTNIENEPILMRKDMDKMKLVQPDSKLTTPFQTFKLEETKKEPFRFDQKKRFIMAIVGSIFILLIFIILVAVVLGKSDGSSFLMRKNAIVGSISIQMVKGMTINKPRHTSHKVSGRVESCTDQKVDELLAEISSRRRTVANIANNKIIVMDLSNTKCRDLLSHKDMKNAKLATLILLDSLSHNSKSVKKAVKAITTFPIVSILQKDVREVLTFTKNGYLLDIWFDDFKEIFKDEDFYNVECNLANQCMHLTTPHPQQVYLGCDGVPKFRTDPKITCTYNGVSCPELAKATEKFKSFSTCDDIEGLPYKKGMIMWPQPTCENGTNYIKLERRKACAGEEAFWQTAFAGKISKSSKTCSNNRLKKSILHVPEKMSTKMSGKLLCGTKAKSCKRWGPWFTSNDKREPDYRYCKDGPSCTIMEIGNCL